jgi:hypothetical protein
LQGREWQGLDGTEHRFIGGNRCWRHSARALRNPIAAPAASGRTVLLLRKT